MFISSPDLVFFGKEEEGVVVMTEDPFKLVPKEGNGITTVTNESQICVFHQWLSFFSEGVDCFLSGELTEAGSQMFTVY